MNKQEFLKMIEDMPDNLIILPIEFTEQDMRDTQEFPWENQYKQGVYGGIYQKDVDNILTLKLQFKTRVQGEFRRKYEDPDGTFYNMKRIM